MKNQVYLDITMFKLDEQAAIIFICILNSVS